MEALKSVKAFVLQPFVNKFASQFRLITPSAQSIMAVIRNTSSARRVGRVGNTTYYVANGQQIARQSRNDSNYGIDASRSRAQQMRRVRWSNLVNLYKACKTWMPKAFESKKQSQSDYNKFVSLNINSSAVCLTKDQATGGCSVMSSYIVSQGSLSPITYRAASSQGTAVVTSLAIGTSSLAELTVGDLAAEIIGANTDFQVNDNIAVILFKTWEPKGDFPYTVSQYQELTLDLNSEVLLSNTAIGALLEVSGGKLAIKASVFGTNLYQCVAVIHTRKVGGKLLTSTQQAYPNISDFIDEYSTQDQEELAIQSYGVNEDVPLDPSFKLGSIISISIDGVVSPSVRGSIVEHSGACSLTIVGDNLTADNYELRFDDTVYTPLVEEGNSKTYILSANGTARIFLNGYLIGGVKITGVSIPSDINRKRWMGQLPSLSTYWGQAVNKVQLTADCVNYAHKSNSSLPYFYFAVGWDSGILLQSDFSLYNCEIDLFHNFTDDGYTDLYLHVVDSSKVAYIQYKDLIVAVFNY